MKDLLESKKFRALLMGLIATIIASIFGREGVITEETANQIALLLVILFGTYIGAQGAADFGKEAEKIKRNGGK